MITDKQRNLDICKAAVSCKPGMNVDRYLHNQCHCHVIHLGRCNQMSQVYLYKWHFYHKVCLSIRRYLTYEKKKWSCWKRIQIRYTRHDRPYTIVELEYNITTMKLFGSDIFDNLKIYRDIIQNIRELKQRLLSKIFHFNKKGGKVILYLYN